MITKKSLRELGYHFNSSGELRSIEDNQRFKFTTQLAYEKVGNAMIEELYSLMENRYNLKRLPLKPLDSQIQDNRVSFIFASPDFENKDILLILIHGMGAVRAGQWGRRLILNENLDRGSQLPYIERALKNGWGVIVLNTNNNISNVEEEDQFLKFSRNSEQHTYNTYVRFIEKSNNRVIHVVAHSRGGSDISYLINRCHDEKRLGVVCLTDSWFKFLPERTHYPIIINWTTSKHVDQIIECQKTSKGHVIYQLYAGTSEHDRSSYTAIDSVFYILENDPSSSNIRQLLNEAGNIIRRINSDLTYDSEKLEFPIIRNVVDDGALLCKCYARNDSSHCVVKCGHEMKYSDLRGNMED